MISPIVLAFIMQKAIAITTAFRLRVPSQLHLKIRVVGLHPEPWIQSRVPAGSVRVLVRISNLK